MKNTLLALLAVAFVSSLCFAQQTPAPVVKAAAEVKSFVGKADSVSLADAAKGTKSEITVLDEAGKKMNFLVKLTTTIYDVNSSTIALDKIKKDEKVKVKYDTTKEGVNEATSIHIMK